MSVIHMIKAVSHNPYRYEWDQMVHFEVLIENIAFEKEVYAHVRLEGNEWFDVPLAYRGPAAPSHEIWSGDYWVIQDLPELEFAFVLRCNNQEFWDNNSGANYRIRRQSQGTSTTDPN
jgi:hypothetical protein